MTKKINITLSIVIVESPAKCKKIESFLGPGYKVIASFGHLREIASLKNIDIENGFKVIYSIVDDERKKKHIEWMRCEMAKGDEVILATDADREGEAIAWHICDLFGLPVSSTKRIVFHEITESAIQKAIRNPGRINIPLVHSQQARQILDLLVGFTVTPVLWKHMSNKTSTLSAGRCQTPALQLIYDNDREIRENPGKIVFQTKGYFTKLCLPFYLLEKSDTNEKSEIKLLHSREDIHLFMEESTDFNHILSVPLSKRVCYEPPSPLTTSQLQQKASNEFHFSPKETMKLAQHLYEEGYITYMRTDSTEYSEEFLASVKEWILKEYNNNDTFLSISIFKREKGKGKGKEKKTNVESTVAAHEAIRPTNIGCREIQTDIISTREKKLYKLIWETTVESCMSAAQYDSLTSIVTAPQNRMYEYKCEQMVFPGFKCIKGKGMDPSKEFAFLSNEKRERVVECLSIRSEMNIIEKKQHYTEARLVHLLEERGIGRPSTFSSLVEKIQERKYVTKKDIPGIQMDCSVIEWRRNDKGQGTINESIVKREIGAEKGKLVIQPLGVLVCEFLSKQFASLFRYEYTNEMETALDAITTNSVDWKELCSICHSDLQTCIKEVKQREDIVIDEEHTFIIGKNGPVIKRVDKMDQSVSFLSVKPDINMHLLQTGALPLSDIVLEKDDDNKISLGEYEGKNVTVQKGKYGLYVRWNDTNISLSSLGNRPTNNISLDEVIAIIVCKTSKTTSNIVRKITDNIDIRKGEYGDYLFYKTSKMKRPVFYKLDGFEGNYKTVHIDILKRWIREKYNISLAAL
jgi:DNA topoisomerase-1